MIKKKIGFINSFYPLIVGGAEYQAKIIATELVNDGYDVFFISIGHEENKVIEIDQIMVYCYKNPAKIPHQYTWYYFFLKIINNILDKEKPDIIYQRMITSFSPSLSKYANKKNIPFVIHIANKHSLRFDNSMRSRIRWLFFKTIKKYRPFFIVQNNEQDKLLQSLGIQAELNIPNMVNLSYHQKGALEEPYQVFWIGNNRPIKQLDLFLNICKDLKDNNKISFKIIGSLTDKLYLEEIDLLPNVEYLGKVSNEEVNNFLKSAFLLVNTSKSEGFSNTFIQSWMHGTPVISLNSNPNNYINDFKVGVCCNGSQIELVESVNNFINDFNLYWRTVDNCKNLCKNELDYKMIRTKILNFFKKIEKK